MRKKLFVILVLFSFLNVASLAFLITTTTGVTTTEPLLNEPLRLGSKIRDADYGINEGSAANGKGSSSTETTDYSIEETKMWLGLDDYNGYYFFTYYELWDVGIGESTEIWIQANLGWQDPDPQRRSYPVITGEQVTTLLDEFEGEGGIVDTDEAYFGTPDPHDGWDAPLVPVINSIFGLGAGADYFYSPTGKNVILVSNVRDDNYFTDFPYYIAGFYSPTFEFYFDRNIISIDSYQWEERVGPDGDRPYLYEGVIAHEYQHLIHDDFFTPFSDATFMNEGSSMFAEYLCGYPTAWGDINSFLATPDNSLTEWGDQGGINILADYGAALLWATYLNDVVSGTFLQEYIQAGRVFNGVIAGGVDLLDYLLGDAYSTDFETMFKAWRLANLMGTGYTSFDWDDRENDGVHLTELKEKWPTDFRGTDLGNTITILGRDTGVSKLGSYGTDYILLSKLKWQGESELRFDGDEFVVAPHWVYEDDSWYSTPGGAFSDLELFLHVDLSELGASDDAILSIYTMYDIEPFWDYGFVQIWNLDLDRWDTLDDVGDYCTMLHEDAADQNIVDNLPGLTGSTDWTTINFDLSDYKGQNTRVRFRYMTDPLENYPGWWIDAVSLNDVPFNDMDLYVPDSPTTHFFVTIMRQDFFEGEYTYSFIADIVVDASNDGFIELDDYLEPLIGDFRNPDVLLVITPRLGMADYSVSVVRT